MVFEQHGPQNNSPIHRSRSSFRGARGWSLLEMMVVLAIFLTVAGFSVMGLQPAWKQQRVTTAYNSLLMTLRRAHDQAAADMRVYVVSFVAPGTITVTQNTVAGPVLVTTVLPPDITLHLEPGMPNSATVQPTTPDGFGTAAFAVDFNQGIGAGAGTTIYFQPDGSATDINGNINNGVVYFGRPGDFFSTRAVTLWGVTGRLRGWRLYPNGAGNIWRQQ